MSVQTLNPEQYQPVAQAILAYFDREDVNIPGNMVESIVSGKSLMRALLNGQLVLAQNVQAPAENVEAAQQSAAVKKQASKKDAKKAA